MDIKVLFGVASVVPAAVGYVPYVVNIFRGKTKPHAYSWLVWSAIALVGFIIQFEGHGGPGAWLLGLATMSTFSVFLLSLFYGHKDIQLSDKVSLALATVAFVFLIVTDRPLISAILITIVEAVGAFFPTFRKSYDDPYEETALNYFTYAVSIGLSLLALEHYSLANVLYPSVDMLMYAGLVAFLLARRSKIKPPQRSAS
jgi:hypothetical protein